MEPETKETETPTEDVGVIKGAASLTEFAPGRWAVIKKIDEAFDKKEGSREEVMDIKLMAPGTRPDLYDLEDEDNEARKDYSVEQVPGGVIIGMRRGGEFEAVGGFGWRDAEDKIAHGSPVGPGAARLAEANAR